MESKTRFALPYSWVSINWIVAQTEYISRFGCGPKLDCVHVQISLLSDEVSQTVDIGIEERRKKSTQGRHRSGKGASYSTQGVFQQTNNQIIIHLILTYYFSELSYISCYFILFMASPERDKEEITLVDRKRQKKRKAEHSPPLHTPSGSSSTSTPGIPT